MFYYLQKSITRPTSADVVDNNSHYLDNNTNNFSQHTRECIAISGCPIGVRVRVYFVCVACTRNCYA